MCLASGAERNRAPLCRTTRALMTTRLFVDRCRTCATALRPRPRDRVPCLLPFRSGVWPFRAAARRTCAASLWPRRLAPLPLSLLLPGLTRKSLSSRLILPVPDDYAADFWASGKHRMAGAVRCHTKLLHYYNHMRAGCWHSFYLALQNCPLAQRHASPPCLSDTTPGPPVMRWNIPSRISRRK